MKLVAGVGVNDADYKIQLNGVICPYYTKWSAMLQRCYSVKSHVKYPTYADCTVCEEWLSFMNFRAWMMQQDWEGKHLDKDLLVHGNKVYSPSTCLMVDAEINTACGVGKHKNSKTLLGTWYNRSTKMWYSSISRSNVWVELGCYSSELEAHQAWQRAKSNHLEALAEKQNSNITKALMTIVARIRYEHDSGLPTRSIT